MYEKENKIIIIIIIIIIKYMIRYILVITIISFSLASYRIHLIMQHWYA